MEDAKGMDAHLLTLITFIPAIGMAVIVALPKAQEQLIKWTAALFAAIPLLLSIRLLQSFDRVAPGFQFTEKHAWIPSFNIEYLMGVDGMSVAMILLTTSR